MGTRTPTHAANARGWRDAVLLLGVLAVAAGVVGAGILTGG